MHTAADDRAFCLEVLDNGKMTLKTSHSYYYQVIVQIIITSITIIVIMHIRFKLNCIALDCPIVILWS